MNVRAAIVALTLLPFGAVAWGANNKPPSVSLTAPVPGSTFSTPATIAIAANASDPDGSVAKVEFFRGTTLIGTRTTPPYEITWSNAGIGTHSLTARATDNSGATKTSAAVSIAVVPPRLFITYPPDGAMIYGGSVPVTGTFVGDATSTILVDHGDSSVLATISGNEYRATVPLLDGPLVVRVSIARRDKSSDTASVAIVGNRSPLVVFTSPANVALAAPANIDFAVDALSPAGVIAKVDFVRNGSVLGTATVPPYRFTWANAAVGTHVVTAVATDANGYAGTASRTITISGPNAAPSVVLTSPSSGASFMAPASIAMAAQASDADGTVTLVEFLQNGSVIGVTNVAPYAANWSGVPAGTYSLTARATDNRSAVSTSVPVSINVMAPNAPPVVTLTAPVAGSDFVEPAVIALAAAATDPDGFVTRVDYFQGAILLASATVPPYSAEWSNVMAGNYTLTAKATDNAGTVAVSAPVAISVTSNRPPTVQLTSPTGGESYGAPATIALAASALDTDGTIARVDFFEGSTLVGSVSAPPYAREWTVASPGNYSITARATDNRGAVATSPAVAVSVTGAAVAIDTPMDGAAIQGDVVTVSGTLQAPANSGVTVNGIVAAVSGNRFHANDVPLNPGNNVLSAVLTTLADYSSSHAINVTSTGPSPVRISAAPTQGLAPLTVMFAALAQDDAIQDMEIDTDGDGMMDTALAGPPWTAEVTYAGAGTVTPVVRVTHASGSTTKPIPVVVTSEAELDQTLRAVWSGMKNALEARDMNRAMLHLDHAARLRYGPVFDLLLPSMSQIVATFSDLQPSMLSDALGEYAVNRMVDGENRLFLIYFGRGGDGVWRLGSM